MRLGSNLSSIEIKYVTGRGDGVFMEDVVLNHRYGCLDGVTSL